MKAIVQERYGAAEEVLALREVEIPSVSPRDVLVRVHATTVAGDDWHIMRGLPYVARLATGLRQPKHRIPGRDVAGVVESVGRDARRLRLGDEVFGWCDGAFAEYASVPEEQLVQKPANVTLDQAAAVPISAFTALQGLRDMGELRRGQKVLINGAAGGVGTFAVQIAKSLGAVVTGVCSTENLDLVRSIGADRAVDYTAEDFTRTGRYDVILDLIANRSLAECRRALKSKGILVMAGSRGGRWFMGTERWLKALLLSPFVTQRLRPLIHADRKEDLETLKALIESGYVTPVIDARYTLGEVADAVRYLEGRHARGKVVIRIDASRAH